MPAPRTLLVCGALGLAAALVASSASRAEEEPASPFAPSRLTTSTGKLVDPDYYYPAEDCGLCHVEQLAAWQGSIHSRSHEDGIYLAFADLAREEGGDELYRFCSGCHAPGAVATGEIPGGEGAEATFLTHEGVTCVVCHSVREVRRFHAGGGADGSLVVEETERRYGPIEDPGQVPVHESTHAPLHAQAEFCSACHTLTHPGSGLVIENTYEEWKASPYAEAGVVCQDCHMRTVEQAREVARTMKPLRVPGKAAEGGPERPDVHAHLFVGANVNHALTGGSEAHARAAEERLRSAATVALELPEAAAPGEACEVVVAVANVGAGHAIPTSITELRQLWVDLAVTDATGEEVYRSGAVDEATGAVDPDAVMYHSVLADAEGQVTYLPWRAVKTLRERLVPPRQTVRETYRVPIPAGARPPFAVRAVLRYRSAPQEVLDRLFGRGRFPLRVVDVAEAIGMLR